MKRYSILLCVGLSLAAIATSCTDRFDSMNRNPGAVNNASLKYVLPFVQEYGAHLSCTPYQLADNLYPQRFCQYYANTQTAFPTDRYGYNDGWSSGGFWEPYFTTLKHAKEAKETAALDASDTNLYQMIRIMQAVWTAEMTDCFGDIPYTTAGLGETKNKYDSQESIYKDIFKELTEAVDVLKQNLPNQESVSADNDLLFAGDVQKWIRFANSLRLRYALRISYKAPELAKQEGEAALAAGVMESNSDNAYMTCNGKGAWGWGHPLYMMSSWHEFTMSSTMENMLTSLSSVTDPRLPMWFGQTEDYVAAKREGKPYTGKQFAGLPNGMNTTEIGIAANAPSAHSVCLGLQAYPLWNSQEAPTADVLNVTVTLPLKIMTYGEVCFLKAEAALRGWSGAGTAADEYNKGIQASIDDERAQIPEAYRQFAPSTNDVTYRTTGKVAWDESATAEQKLEKIATQKWLALYPNGMEAWAEVRRTGYPKLTPVLHSDEPTINPAAGEFIKKIRYLDSERRENAENANSKSLNQGQGDGPNVRVWWDTKRYK